MARPSRFADPMGRLIYSVTIITLYVMTATKRIHLGPHETRLLWELEARESDLFTIRDAREILRRRDVAPILHRLRSKGRVVQVRKGQYLLVPARAGIEGAWSESIFRVIDAILGEGYYVGFWTAMNYWGMTEQVPRTVHVVIPGRRRSFRFQGQPVRFVTMKPARLFGMTREAVGKGSVSISDRERTILDGLLYPRYVGGISEVVKALSESRRELEWSRLEAYVTRLGVDAVHRRLGYLLDLLGLQVPFRRRLRKAFMGFRWLDPSAPPERRGYSKDWGLILNVSRSDLLAWRRT